MQIFDNSLDRGVRKDSKGNEISFHRGVRKEAENYEFF